MKCQNVSFVDLAAMEVAPEVPTKNTSIWQMPSIAATAEALAMEVAAEVPIKSTSTAVMGNTAFIAVHPLRALAPEAHISVMKSEKN